jgi:hypothetical protein
MCPVFLPLLEASLKLTFWTRVGQSATVHDFYGHPENDTLMAAISFLETGDTIRDDQQSKDGESQ